MSVQILIAGQPGIFPESLSVMLSQRHRDMTVRQVSLPCDAYILAPQIFDADLIIVTNLSFITDNDAPLVTAIRDHKDTPPLLVLNNGTNPVSLHLPAGLGDVTLVPKGRPLSTFLQAVRETLEKSGVVLLGEQRTRIKLTRREREVLDALSDGKSNKEIAQGLDIAPNTVRVHVSALLQKLSVRNRVEAAVMARSQQEFQAIEAVAP